jgi:hypothetical protein
MFVEKKYACDVRFKINVITFLTNDEKKKMSLLLICLSHVKCGMKC